MRVSGSSMNTVTSDLISVLKAYALMYEQSKSKDFDAISFKNFADAFSEKFYWFEEKYPIVSHLYFDILPVVFTFLSYIHKE